jgi:hypothetical protein
MTCKMQPAPLSRLMPWKERIIIAAAALLTPLSHDTLFPMADSTPVRKTALVTSPKLTDKVIFYFVDHRMQILTAIVLLGAGVFIARWVGNLIPDSPP